MNRDSLHRGDDVLRSVLPSTLFWLFRPAGSILEPPARIQLAYPLYQSGILALNYGDWSRAGEFNSDLPITKRKF